MPCPSSGTITLLDIKTEMGSAANPFTLTEANAGTYGALSWTSCGSWTADGSLPVDIRDFLSYDHSFSGAPANGNSASPSDCAAQSGFGCGVDGDTYNVFHNGCNGYYCTFVQSGCI